MMILSVEEVMVRVNEEKISKYRGVFNNEVEALIGESDYCSGKDSMKVKEKGADVIFLYVEIKKGIYSNRDGEINRCDENLTSIFKCLISI